METTLQKYCQLHSDVMLECIGSNKTVTASVTATAGIDGGIISYEYSVYIEHSDTLECYEGIVHAREKHDEQKKQLIEDLRNWLAMQP